MTNDDNYENIPLGDVYGDPAAAAENIISTIKKVHPKMEPGDVFAVKTTFAITQSAIGLSPDEMRAHIVRQLRALATHLAS